MQQNQQNTDSMFYNSIKTEDLGRRILTGCLVDHKMHLTN